MAKRQSHSRGYSPRKVNTREVKQRFLIVCEGKKTEPNYFRSFRVPKNVIDIKGIGVNPSQVVEKAITFSQEDEYDQVWCVFDRDSWTAEDFNKAIQKAENLNFKVAYSNEAFELWYLLHFEYITTGIPRENYKDKLNHFLQQKYEKNSGAMYAQLEAKQADAIRNAENLLKQYHLHRPEQDNPSTTVHLLVQELNRFIS